MDWRMRVRRRSMTETLSVNASAKSRRRCNHGSGGLELPLIDHFIYLVGSLRQAFF